MSFNQVQTEDAVREPAVKAYLDGFPSNGWIDLNFQRYGPDRILLPGEFTKWTSHFENLQVRPDDVWLLSVPKCGSTWTQEMVWLICNNLDFAKAKKLSLPDRFPMLELECIQETSNATKSWDLIAEMASPRFIKTHLTPSLLPKQLETVKPKIVATVRNPKDACVSHYHHNKNFNGFQGSLDDFVKAFVSDAVPFAPYWNVVKILHYMRSEPNVLFLTFEEMKTDLSAVVRKTGEFFGVELTSEQVSDLVAHLSFDRMKTNKAVNNDYILEHSKLQGWQVPENAAFIRKGKVGSWKEEMSEESVKLMDEWIKANEIPGLYEA